MSIQLDSSWILNLKHKERTLIKPQICQLVSRFRASGVELTLVESIKEEKYSTTLTISI